MQTRLIRQVLWLAGLAASFICHADEPLTQERLDAAPRYMLRDKDLTMPLANQREVARGGLIPYDKRYDELSADEKAMLKSQYERMGEDDEPPYPIAGTAPIFKAVQAAAAAVEPPPGLLRILVKVDSRGEAESAEVYVTPSPEIARVVGTILMKQRYKPARCAGSPCAMVYPFRVTLGY